MTRKYILTTNESGKVVFEAEPTMDEAGIDEAIKEHGGDVVATAFMIDAFKQIAERVELDIEGKSPAEVFQAVIDWVKEISVELGCKPRLPDVAKAIGAQKKELKNTRVHADLALAKLTPTERRRCERSNIDPSAYARAKAKLTLDELQRLDERGGDVIAAAKQKDDLAAVCRMHGISEHEALSCARQGVDPAKYAVQKRATDARTTRSGKAGAL